VQLLLAAQHAVDAERAKDVLPNMDAVQSKAAKTCFDPWGAEIRYLVQGDKIVVYSLGPNAEDEMGKGDDIPSELKMFRRDETPRDNGEARAKAGGPKMKLQQ
jgi:hypothetical protein